MGRRAWLRRLLPETIMSVSPSSIGVLGGLGPYAGLDLVHKIFDCCAATKDQDHLPVILYSFPAEIPPRVEFLLDDSPDNPGHAMGGIMVRLARAGATVIGMPCNTAHSASILDAALERLKDSGFTGCFVNMITATAEYIARNFPQVRRVGVLCTQGAHASRVFDQYLGQAGLDVLYPDAAGREKLQRAISDPAYGLKAFSSPVTEKAWNGVTAQARRMAERQVDLILLGCTELPLALAGKKFEGIPLVDPTRVLARCLVQAYAPHALRPEPGE